MSLLPRQMVRHWGIVLPPIGGSSLGQSDYFARNHLQAGVGAIAPLFVNSSGTDVFWNDCSRAILWVRNNSGVTVTVTVPKKASGAPAGSTDIVVTITAGQEKVIGPVDRRTFNDAINPQVPVGIDGICYTDGVHPGATNDKFTDYARVICTPSAGVTLAAFQLL